MIRFTFLVLALGLLSACGQVRLDSAGPEGKQAWKQRTRQLNILPAWNMQGRISVVSEQDGWHASLYWQQKNDRYQLKIIGPLGQGTVELNGSEYRVSLRSTREPHPVIAASPERLLRRVMGWEVPVTGMRFWVRGLPVPDQRYRISVDSQGRPLRLKQSGWTIQYSRYRKVQGVFLPVKIKMQNNRLKVKLIISRWS